jgi:hypothetical protein
MACATITTPLGTAFICGLPTHTRKKCAFCNARNVKALCDWPVKKPTVLTAADVIVGDKLISPKSKLTVKVINVQEWRGGLLDISIAETRGTRLRFWNYIRAPSDAVTLLRPGTCDNACCFRHRRHVGPDRDYCMDHWALTEASA